MSRLPLLVLSTAVLAIHGTLAQGKAPKVVKLVPPHQAVEVDGRTTKTLVVTFDQPMNRRGYSFCGGGPKFPKALRSRWKDKFTCIMTVELEPDHDYELSLNCPAANNFRSAKGVPLAPTPWRFSTLPAKLPSKKKQRQLNKQSLERLGEILATRYSYFDHRGLDWQAIYKKHRKAILSCRTTRGWANAVGEMLKPAGDIHLYLRIGENTVGTASRAVDPLYRRKLLGNYFTEVSEPTTGVLTAATKDGIGYVMISSWTDRIDFDRLEELMTQMSAVKAMVVDVRPNSGGSENLARRVAQWFVKGTKTYAKNVYRVRAGKKGFGPVLERKIQGNKDDRRFKGPVAVLMSRYCMSSCEAFLLMMRQGERCTLIGQRSYGSSGNPKPHEIPNGVVFVVPSWKALRPDGSCFEGEGIAPDIEVVPTEKELEKRDLILEKALEHLRKQK